MRDSETMIRLSPWRAWLILALAPAALAADHAPDPQIPQCEPVPKLLHYEMLEDSRESRIPHHGRLHVSVIIDRKGQVRQVDVVDSTDDWFNEVSIQSVLEWRYAPPSHACRAIMTLKFQLSD